MVGHVEYVNLKARYRLIPRVPFIPGTEFLRPEMITQYVHLEYRIPTTLKHDIKFLTAQLQRANQQQPKMSFKAAVAAISNFGKH